MSWSIQDHIKRIGLTAPERKYLNNDGTPKAGYSLVPSQSNPNPVKVISRKNNIKGGGFNTVSLAVYKKDAPRSSAPAPAAPAQAPTPPPKPKPKPEPVQLSKEAATAIGRAKAYEDNLRPNYGNYIIAGDGTVIDNYNRDTIDNTEEASRPYFDDDVDRNEAQAYADKYKLELGDDLKLRAIV